MHPVIRLLCLLVFAALAPWLPSAAVFAAATGLLVWGIRHPATGLAMWRGLRRIRWLLISIIVLFAWFSPGPDLFPSLGPLSPSGLGVVLAIERAGVLLVMVWAAIALLLQMPTQLLISSVRAVLAWPIRTRAGTRFADRIGLLLVELPLVEARVRRALDGIRTRNLAARAAALFEEIEQGEATPVAMEQPPALAPVPAVQWALPVLLFFAGACLIFLTR